MASRKMAPQNADQRTAAQGDQRPHARGGARGGARGEAQGRCLTRQIRDVVLQLQQVQSAVMVAVAALRGQACDLDEDIAQVLQRAVAERLHEQMDLLEASLQGLARGKP